MTTSAGTAGGAGLTTETGASTAGRYTRNTAPACGALSYAAAPLVVLALLIERALFDAPQPQATVLVLIWGAAYLVSLVMVFLGFWVWRALRPSL